MLLFITRIRPENENGPLTHSALRAPGLIVGLGRESCVPPGPRLSLLNVSRPSASNGHTWIPAEQNAVGALARTLGFIHASSRRAALVGRRATRRRMAPWRALSPARAPTDGWTRRRRAAPRRGPTRTAMAGPEPAVTSGGSRSTHVARRSAANGGLQGEISKCLTLLVLLRFNRIPFFPLLLPHPRSACLTWL
jgi:hypothetical protein